MHSFKRRRRWPRLRPTKRTGRQQQPRRKRPRPGPSWTMWRPCSRAWRSWRRTSPTTRSRTLPEAGPLESAKSYREKKAKPLMGEDRQGAALRLPGLLRPQEPSLSGCRAAYDREVSKNGSLSARIYEVCAERDGSERARSGTMSGSDGPLARNRRTGYWRQLTSRNRSKRSGNGVQGQK